MNRKSREAIEDAIVFLGVIRKLQERDGVAVLLVQGLYEELASWALDARSPKVRLFDLRCLGQAMFGWQWWMRFFTLKPDPWKVTIPIDILQLSHVAEHSIDGSIHFICVDWRHMGALMSAGLDAYDEFKNLIV